MSVGILKRLLSIVNVVAVLAIAATAYGFVSHRSEMKSAWNPPDFVVPPRTRNNRAIIIDNTAIQLGSFPKPVEVTSTGDTKKKEVKLKAEIDKLGVIKFAIVAYPPYAGSKPALGFEYNDPPIPDGKNQKIYVITLGEALITRPHSDPELRAWGDRENVRFEFVGCKPDPENEGWTLFEFDIDCDGKDIQTARWKGETKSVELPAAKYIREEVKSNKIFRTGNRKPKPAEPNAGNKPGTTSIPDVKPVRPIRITEVSGPIFQSENGALATTDAGVAYLRDNYNKVLKETQTSPYSDRSGRIHGLKIRRIAKGSVANEFGIKAGDVILEVNGNKVSTKAQAVNIVKRELNKKPAVRYIEVKILRLGATKILRFDTRDPATRRKAVKGLRNH